MALLNDDTGRSLDHKPFQGGQGMAALSDIPAIRRQARRSRLTLGGRVGWAQAAADQKPLPRPPAGRTGVIGWCGGRAAGRLALSERGTCLVDAACAQTGRGWPANSQSIAAPQPRDALTVTDWPQVGQHAVATVPAVNCIMP